MMGHKNIRILTLLNPAYTENNIYRFSLEIVEDKAASQTVARRVENEGYSRESPDICGGCISDRVRLSSSQRPYVLTFELEGALEHKWNLRKGENEISYDHRKTSSSRRVVITVPIHDVSPQGMASIVFTNQEIFVHRVTIMNIRPDRALGINSTTELTVTPPRRVQTKNNDNGHTGTTETRQADSTPRTRYKGRPSRLYKSSSIPVSAQDKKVDITTSTERLDVDPERYAVLLEESSLHSLSKELGPNDCGAVLTYLDVCLVMQRTNLFNFLYDITQANVASFVHWKQQYSRSSDPNKDYSKEMFDDLMEALESTDREDVKSAIKCFMRSDDKNLKKRHFQRPLTP